MILLAEILLTLRKKIKVWDIFDMTVRSTYWLLLAKLNDRIKLYILV